MPRSLALIRASIVALVAAAALAGCTQAPTAAPTSSCAGSIQKVLLTDDSASTVTAFDASDLPKAFAIPAAPAPTCYYKTSSTPAAINGVSYTVTHRTLLYIGLSDSEAAALIAALRKTVSVAPWTISYDNAPVIAASPSPKPTTVTAASSALWEYNIAGKSDQDRGELGYYEAAPITQGTAIHAGLAQAVNVVRVETELRHPQ